MAAPIENLRYLLPPCQMFPLGEHPMDPSSSQTLVLEIYILNRVELSDQDEHWKIGSADSF